MSEEKRVQISFVISQIARDLIVKHAPGKHAYGYAVDAAIKHFYATRK